jgi:excisionase family DNA binding protein
VSERAPKGGVRARARRVRRATTGVLHHNALSEEIAVGVELDEPLLTADQVANLLAVPRSSVYEYARRLVRPLPSIEVGRHRRFYRSDVETWLTTMRAT